jgi:hypothetical protein
VNRLHERNVHEEFTTGFYAPKHFGNGQPRIVHVLQYCNAHEQIDGIVLEWQDAIEDDINLIESKQITVDDILPTFQNSWATSIIENYMLLVIRIEQVRENVVVFSGSLDRRYDVNDEIVNSTFFLRKFCSKAKSPKPAVSCGIQSPSMKQRALFCFESGC